MSKIRITTPWSLISRLAEGFKFDEFELIGADVSWWHAIAGAEMAMDKIQHPCAQQLELAKTFLRGEINVT